MSARLPLSLIDKKPNIEARLAILDDRIALDWQGLLEDIDRWVAAFPNDPDLSHHLTQFKLFAQHLHNTLLANFDDKIIAPIAERRIMLGSLINGVLTSQWFVLRQVAQQRLAGSPYREDIEALEEIMAGYYGRLYQALPAAAQNDVPSSPPFIFLGRITELTIFRQPKTPTVMSLPIGVLTIGNDKSKGAIAHETGHAIFSCLPTFLDELTAKVSQAFPDIETSQKPILKTIVGWLEEMVADCTGTALEGLLHGESAIWLTTAPDQNAGIGSCSHPPGTLRPFIHLKMLNYLAEQFADEELGAKYRSEAELLEKKINLVSGDLLNRRFESIQALTIVTLAEVRALMDKVLNYVLRECQLTALSDETLGKVLLTSISGGFKPAVKGQDKWGESIVAEGNEFILELPVFTLDHIDPSTLQTTFCNWLGLNCVPIQYG